MRHAVTAGTQATRARGGWGARHKRVVCVGACTDGAMRSCAQVTGFYGRRLWIRTAHPRGPLQGEGSTSWARCVGTAGRFARGAGRSRRQRAKGAPGACGSSGNAYRYALRIATADLVARSEQGLKVVCSCAASDAALALR